MSVLGTKVKSVQRLGHKAVGSVAKFGQKHRGKFAVAAAVGGVAVGVMDEKQRQAEEKAQEDASDQQTVATAKATHLMNVQSHQHAVATSKRLMSANTPVVHSHGAARDNLSSHLATRPSSRPIPRAPLLPAPPAPRPGPSRGYEGLGNERRADRLQFESDFLGAKAAAEANLGGRGHTFTASQGHKPSPYAFK